VLHDIFAVPFSSIAQTVGRPAPTCRQLARRARQKITDSQGGATFEVGGAEHRQVTEKFIAACARGDLDGLLQVLAPDVWGDFDGGPGRTAPVTHGAGEVARRRSGRGGPGRSS
jgi:RNA polymerase sigma-70 factor, ECF subfamily